MVGLGMNSFINSQGFGKMGMMTVLLGAVTNILLDPLFIFVLHMGVQGAALATVISQFLSAAWVFRFLTGKKAIYRLQKKTMKPNWKLVGEICLLYTSGAPHPEEVGKGGDDGNDGEGQPQAGEGQGRRLGDVSDVHPVHHAVEDVDELGQGHGQGQVEDVAGHLAL